MKAFWQSKTFWFNLLALIVAVAGIFGFADFQPSQDMLEVFGAVVTVINLVLRFITKEPVGWK